MDAVVVDTDVVSFIFKRDTRVEVFRPLLEGKLLVVSFMTVAELYHWALARNWGDARTRQLEEHLRNLVVYPFDHRLCLTWARVSDMCRKNGRQIGCADAWVAATALHRSIPLVTNNVAHYAGVDGLILRVS